MTELWITFSIWLTPQSAKMNWIHVFWLGVRSCKKKFFMAIIINRLLTKLVWSRWLDIGPKKKNKKQSNKLGHSPAILTHPWSTVHIYCPTLCLELKSLTQNIKAVIFWCGPMPWREHAFTLLFTALTSFLGSLKHVDLLFSPSGTVCSCYKGFSLASDNKTCDDINECEEPGSCSQQCFNSKGSYTCRCVEGYNLEYDGKHCKAAGKRELFIRTPL